MSDKPIILSRACIRDTLLLKRLCPEKMTGLAHSLYNLNVQTLRRNQLAPYLFLRLIEILPREELSFVKQIAFAIYLTGVLDGDFAPHTLKSAFASKCSLVRCAHSMADERPW